MFKEDSPPVYMDPLTLETKDDYYTFGGKLDSQTHTAHPKIDPLTGEYIGFGYEADGLLSKEIFVFSADRHGAVNWSTKVQAPYAGMMHDFVVTQRHIVLYLTNMVSDMDRIKAGGVHFSYDSTAPCYIGVMRRGGDGKDLRWFTGQNLFCTHSMGGWSDGDKVTMVWDGGEGNQFPFFPSLHEPFDPAKSTGLLRRFTIDLSSKSNDRYQVETIYPRGFGRACAAGRPFPHAEVSLRLSQRLRRRRAAGGSSTTRRRPPSLPRCRTTQLSEMTFVPRKKDAPEGDGYLIGLGSSMKEAGRSDLILIDTKDVAAGPGGAGQDAVQMCRPGPRLLGRCERHPGSRPGMSFACWARTSRAVRLLFALAMARPRRSRCRAEGPGTGRRCAAGQARSRRVDGDRADLGRTAFQPAQADQRQERRKARARLVCRHQHRRAGWKATPLVIDGVLYNVQPWNITTAYDAKTGQASCGPTIREVPLKYGRMACCDIVSRGLAAWKGKIYVGTLDGRLIALDAKTGKPVWSKLTVDNSTESYTITGAPRDVRRQGASSAMAAPSWACAAMCRPTTPRPARCCGASSPCPATRPTASRTRPWRWPPRPGTASGGSRAAAARCGTRISLRSRACTCVYVGVGNGSPWAQKFRSPGGGDNLFLASIVALNADTGEYVWHYQTTPGEQWDYTATQQMILADLDDRRQAAQGADAGAEERLLLCTRPQDRRAAQRREHRRRSTGRPAST